MRDVLVEVDISDDAERAQVPVELAVWGDVLGLSETAWGLPNASRDAVYASIAHHIHGRNKVGVQPTDLTQRLGTSPTLVCRRRPPGLGDRAFGTYDHREARRTRGLMPEDVLPRDAVLNTLLDDILPPVGWGPPPDVALPRNTLAEDVIDDALLEMMGAPPPREFPAFDLMTGRWKP